MAPNSKIVVFIMKKSTFSINYTASSLARSKKYSNNGHKPLNMKLKSFKSQRANTSKIYPMMNYTQTTKSIASLNNLQATNIEITNP